MTLLTRLAGSLGSIALALAALGMTGCQTYNQQNKGTPQWKAGNIPEAIKEFTRMAEKRDDGKDGVIWRLEQAAALRAGGEFEQSNEAFAAANDSIDQYDAQAKVSVSKETGAIFSNQANLPYTGRDYDRVMISTYRAMNYIQLLQFEQARPELIRAYQRQQDAVENNRKRIEREQQEIEEATTSEKNRKAGESAEKARQDPALQGRLDQAYAPLDELKPYADYVNPFAVYLDGLYFRLFSTGASDLERARKSLERALSFTPGNPYLREELQELDQLLRGETVAPVTYVIFETGSAPWRDQIRIDIPLFFIGDGNVPYAGAAFPRLQTDDHFMPSLNVEIDGVKRTTAQVASMDSVVAQSFKTELPGIITKTLVSTTVKAAASYGVNQAASNQDAVVGLFAKVITAATQIAMNVADTRTWTTLPKEFQICRFPTPEENKTVVFSNPQGTERAELTLVPGSVNIIFVKSVNPNTAFTINQVQLN